jgi:FdhD protein
LRISLNHRSIEGRGKVLNQTKVQRSILQFNNGTFVRKTDTIVTEFPITVKINGEEVVTLVCTPEHIKDLVIGFLISEGAVRKYEDIVDLWIQEKEGVAHVKTVNLNPYFHDFQQKRYMTSCCGKGRQGFIFVNDALTTKKLDHLHSVNISAQECFQLMNEMESSASVFQQTGGVHNAALCDLNNVIIHRMDIGRHNALDKIYGYCLQNDISIENKIIVFSGRISSEILLKVAKMGCEVILSKSAPTELALQLADELGITTIGFIRNHSLNVYTHPKRFLTN